jgi:hypothetical protein
LGGDSTITCAKCGKKNASHYKFCLGCGGELSSAPEASAHAVTKLGVCAKCGKENPSHFKLCADCGEALVGANPAKAQEAPRGVRVEKSEGTLRAEYTLTSRGYLLLVLFSVFFGGMLIVSYRMTSVLFLFMLVATLALVLLFMFVVALVRPRRITLLLKEDTSQRGDAFRDTPSKRYQITIHLKRLFLKTRELSCRDPREVFYVRESHHKPAAPTDFSAVTYSLMIRDGDGTAHLLMSPIIEEDAAIYLCDYLIEAMHLPTRASKG